MEIIAVALLLVSLIWVHIRGFKDGAFSDPVLFLTGVSLIAYMVSRPKRIALPVAVALMAVSALGIRSTSRVPSQGQDAFRAISQGVGAFHRKDLEQAIASFSEAIQLDPRLTEAYYNRGRAYTETGELGKAIADFDEAIGINPKDADAHYGRGVAYFEMGEDGKAIVDFDKAIQLNPKVAEAYYGRGVTYFEMGEDDKAIADLDKVIQLDPKVAEAYYGRAAAYFEKSEYEKAWADVATCEQLGGRVDPEFLAELREASGRDR